jgi:hypothetical protein
MRSLVPLSERLCAPGALIKRRAKSEGKPARDGLVWGRQWEQRARLVSAGARTRQTRKRPCNSRAEMQLGYGSGQIGPRGERRDRGDYTPRNRPAICIAPFSRIGASALRIGAGLLPLPTRAAALVADGCLNERGGHASHPAAGVAAIATPTHGRWAALGGGGPGVGPGGGCPF